MTADIASAPRRQLRGRFWHQGPPGTRSGPSPTRPRLTGATIAAAAQAPGTRLTRSRQRGRNCSAISPTRAWARSRCAGAWAPWTSPGSRCSTSPTRRSGPRSASPWRTSPGEDYARAQEVADAARAAGFGGILAPSAAMEGRRTLVVFATGFPSLVFDRSRVRQPPPRLADLVRLVRLRGDLAAAVRSLLEEVAEAGSGLARRVRRRSPGGR